MVLRRAPCLVSCSAVTLTFSIILSLNVRCVSEVQWPVGTPVSAIRPSTVPRQLLHAAPRSSRARVSSRFTSRRRSARLKGNRSECVTSLTEWGTDGSESCLLFKPELASNAEMQRCHSTRHRRPRNRITSLPTPATSTCQPTTDAENDDMQGKGKTGRRAAPSSQPVRTWCAGGGACRLNARTERGGEGNGRAGFMRHFHRCARNELYVCPGVITCKSYDSGNAKYETDARPFKTGFSP